MWCGAQSWAGWTLERRALPPGGMSVKQGGLPPASIRRAASSQPLLSLPRVPPQRPGAGVGGAVSGSQSLETRVAASPPVVPSHSLCKAGSLGEPPDSHILSLRSSASRILPLPLAASRSAWESDQIPDDRHSRRNNNKGKKRNPSLFF